MEDKTVDRIYWDRIAPAYDERLEKSGRRQAALVRLIRSELKPGFRMLDIGTGTGEIPLAVHDAVCRIEAVDLSGEMIKYASNKAIWRNIRTVGFQALDLSDRLPYDDGCFDVALVANVLHVVPDPDAILAEARRVLKPGGKLLAPTPLLGETPSSRLISRYRRWRGEPIHSRFSSSGLCRLLERCGFRLVRRQSVGGITPCSFVVGVKERDSGFAGFRPA